MLPATGIVFPALLGPPSSRGETPTGRIDWTETVSYRLRD